MEDRKKEKQTEQKRRHHPVRAPIPGLGLRSIKTALAAMLAALIYLFIPDHNPTYACIGAIVGMGTDMEASKQSAGNRFFGTVIGSVVGIGLYWIEYLIFPQGNDWIRLPLVFIGIIVLVSVSVLCRWPGGVQAGGVVLCIILFDTPARHLDYAVWRALDTGVGVLLALAVNALLSRENLNKLRIAQKKDEKTH